MPAHYICDGGCGETTPTPEAWPEHGYALKTRYCPGCEEKVKGYEKARDELHDDVRGRWKAGLEKIKRAFVKDNPKAALPDEPA